MPKNLLLADDSITIQKVVGITFANEDFKVTAVDNGEDAIARAREIKPDIIVADVVMPRKNGYEVCEAVKGDPGLRHIPVLLLAGTFEAFDEARARQARADGHIAKPFESQALISKVKELAGGKVGAPAARPAAAPPAGARPAAAPAPIAGAPRPGAPLPSAAGARPPGPRMPPPGAVRQGGPVPGARPPGPGMPPPGAQRPGMAPGPRPGGPFAPGARPGPGAPPGALRPGGPVPGARPPAPGAPPPAARPAMAPQPAARPSPAAPPRGAPAGPAAAPVPARRDPFGFGVGGPARVEAPPPEEDFGDIDIDAPKPGLDDVALAMEAGAAPRRPIELPEEQPGTPAPELAPVHAFVPPPESVGHRPDASHSAGGDGGEALLREALSKASREVIERVVWEVVPQLAETIIRENLDRLAKPRQQ